MLNLNFPVLDVSISQNIVCHVSFLLKISTLKCNEVMSFVKVATHLLTFGFSCIFYLVSDYLTFRGRLNISELFTLQELSVTKFNLFQHPLQLDNSFQPLIDSLGRLSNRVLELGGWERVELTLRRFSYEG